MPKKSAKRTPKAYGPEVIAGVKRDLAAGMTQEAAAKKNGVSGWTVNNWKTKGMLGKLPKRRITKAKLSKVAKAAKVSTVPTEPAKISKVPADGNLQAEVNALRVALKALVPPAALAVYKAKLIAEAKAATIAASAI
jgi:hypothetical protein